MAHTTYYAAGKRVPSVTTILGVLDVPALKYWAWSEGQAGRHFDETMTSAAWRGTLIHLACELDDPATPLSLCATNDERDAVISGHAAYARWLKDDHVRVDYKETKLISSKHGFGGTCDMVADVDGKRILIDIKTGSGLYSNYLAQQAAYAVAWKDTHPDEPLWGVGLLHIRDGHAELKIWPRSALTAPWQTFAAAWMVYSMRSEIEGMMR